MNPTAATTPQATSTPIAVAAPAVDDAARALVDEVLASGQLAQGPMVARMEALGAEMAGTAHAVAVGNGTDALELAFEVCDLGPGDELVTVPFTFAATANAALRAGATVRFVDIADDFTIDVDRLADAIGDRTRIVCPVHLYGLPARMGPICELVERHGLRLVEDAAQAHGAADGDRRVGGFGIGCFSLYATKNVMAGEGGLVTTDDDEVAELVRTLRNQGMGGPYEYRHVGRNSRMTDLQAAIAIPQLERLDAINAARRVNAETLRAALADVPDLVLPAGRAGATHVWHQFTVLLPDAADRDRVVASLRDEQIFCGVYYPAALNDLPVYRDHERVIAGDTPRARSAAARCLSLPIHHGLDADDVARLADAVARVLAAG